MALTVYQKSKLRTAIYLMVSGIILGLVYVAFSDGFGSIYPLLAGVASGLSIGAVLAYIELILFAGELRKLRFGRLLFFRSVTYLATIIGIILFATAITRGLKARQSVWDIYRSPEYQSYLTSGDFPIAIAYAASLVVLVNFTLLINRKMGQGVLFNYVAGTYYYPRRSERIFMFLDLVNFGEVAQQQNGLVHLNLLNEFYYDLTEPILAYQGNIYQYVDDQSVITWNEKRGIDRARCLEAAFACHQRIDRLAPKYKSKYGLVPKIAIGLHCGPIVRGEVGEVKTDIAYHGDTVNSAARIAEIASRNSLDVLISADLLAKLQLPPALEARLFTRVRPRGKDQEMELFEVIRNGSERHAN